MAEHRWLAVAALFFCASVAATLAGSAAMATMGGMTMPGGWTMSMMWMHMPGQGWADTAGDFMGMWLAMMPAMMLPALMPVLARYRRALDGQFGTTRVDALTARAASGYFAVWLVQGAVVFALGAVLAALVMQYPALAERAPLAAGGLLVAAGAFQMSRWKARRLACCRSLPAHSCAPWISGVRLGLDCSVCCAGLTAALFVAGVMDLRAMALVTLAIGAERLAPHGERVARATGIVLFGVALWLYAGAVGT